MSLDLNLFLGSSLCELAKSAHIAGTSVMRSLSVESVRTLRIRINDPPGIAGNAQIGPS